MTTIVSQVQNFYSEIKFPGLYNIDDLNFYQDSVDNKFLSMYNTGIQGSETVLDVGCGTGFISNLLAIKNPNIKFDAIDFSDSIDYAREFAIKNKIKNIQYHKKDFFNFESNIKYNSIICNGVLHHIPEYNSAIEKIKQLISNNGNIVIGVYNSYGKIIKKIIPIEYRSELLRADQEDVPFEISFTNQEFLNHFSEFKVNSIYPSIGNYFVNIRNLINYKNGGLTVYNLTKEVSL